METEDCGTMLGSLSPRSKSLLKDQAFQKLSILHDHGILHCDVTEENIAVKINKITFIDFGLARICSLNNVLQTAKHVFDCETSDLCHLYELEKHELERLF